MLTLFLTGFHKPEDGAWGCRVLHVLQDAHVAVGDAELFLVLAVGDGVEHGCRFLRFGDADDIAHLPEQVGEGQHAPYGVIDDVAQPHDMHELNQIAFRTGPLKSPALAFVQQP